MKAVFENGKVYFYEYQKQNDGKKKYVSKFTLEPNRNFDVLPEFITDHFSKKELSELKLIWEKKRIEYISKVFEKLSSEVTDLMLGFYRDKEDPYQEFVNLMGNDESFEKSFEAISSNLSLISKRLKKGKQALISDSQNSA